MAKLEPVDCDETSRTHADHYVVGKLRGLARLLLVCLSGAAATSCCYLRGYETPTGIDCWQDPTPPSIQLHEKARRYQERLEAHHQTPSGVIAYRRPVTASGWDTYGNLADGCFHTAIYLSSQALRYATTGEDEAREQILRTLDGLELLMDVTGRRGLLSRHVSPAASAAVIDDARWLPSGTQPAWIWRSDVSKDQYAGFVHGVAVTLALVDDPAVRLRVSALLSAAADHLIENNLRIVDHDGEPTTFSNLRKSFLGVPKGVDSLTSLAIAKAAAVSNPTSRYQEFYESLVRDDYLDAAYWAHFTIFGIGNRVNDHMAYLSLYPLLILENDAERRSALKKAARRSWRHVGEDRNAFFAFIHAAVVGDDSGDADAKQDASVGAGVKGRLALLEYPENKVEWPVDLTRPGFEFERAFFNSRKCVPRSTKSVPLYLRVRSSSFWASDPFRLVGRLGRKGEVVTAGIDYLVAYWMGRYHGLIEPND